MAVTLTTIPPAGECEVSKHLSVANFKYDLNTTLKYSILFWIMREIHVDVQEAILRERW